MSMNRRMNEITPNDPGVKGVAITGSAQAFDPTGRAILVETAGTVTGRLIEDTADLAYVLPVGLHPLAFKSVTSVTGLVGKIIL